MATYAFDRKLKLLLIKYCSKQILYTTQYSIYYTIIHTVIVRCTMCIIVYTVIPIAHDMHYIHYIYTIYYIHYIIKELNLKETTDCMQCYCTLHNVQYTLFCIHNKIHAYYTIYNIHYKLYKALTTEDMVKYKCIPDDIQY